MNIDDMGYKIRNKYIRAADPDQEAAFVAAKREPSPDWVSKLEAAETVNQIFLVAAVGSSTAYISMHERDQKKNWKEIFSTPGFIGKNGLFKTKEGDGKTPVGSFHFNRAFGIEDDPGCAISYHKVTEDDYWSGDQREDHHYNELVSIKDIPDLNREESEHIIDFTCEYQYCLNISWNEGGKAGKGSAIFLHCLGACKPYTGGCIAIPRDKMVTAMKNVKEDCLVVIDTLKNLAPDYDKDWNISPMPGDR